MVNMAYLYSKLARRGLTINGMQPSDLYFECANKLRFALAKDETLTEANYLLGMLFEEGLSVDINHENAYKYYKRAADQGYSKALTKLGHFYYSGFYPAEFPNKTEALTYYQQACDLGDSEACNCIALLYENGFD